MLNFIKRNLSKCSYTTKSAACIYHTNIRPILEYATEVWDPHHKFLIHKIEIDQRYAARWIQSGYRFHSSVTAMKDELGWVTLEQRHKSNRLIQLYKIINGYTLGSQIPATYLPQTIITRCHHHSHFILPAAYTTNYQTSFFYCTIKGCNYLPLNFYSIPTLSIFNSTIINGCNNTYNI